MLQWFNAVVRSARIIVLEHHCGAVMICLVDHCGDGLLKIVDASICKSRDKSRERSQIFEMKNAAQFDILSEDKRGY